MEAGDRMQIVISVLTLVGVLAAVVFGTSCKPTGTSEGKDEGKSSTKQQYGASPGQSDVSLKITPAKPTYGRGEQVTFIIELTNASVRSCQFSRVPEGVIVFLSFMRDGEAVAPILVHGTYIDGFANYLAKNLVSVAPGKSVSMSIRSAQYGATENRPAMETSTLGPEDEAAVALWPIDVPGRYDLDVRYVLPPLPNAPANLCLASGEPVRTEFTVQGG